MTQTDKVTLTKVYEVVNRLPKMFVVKNKMFSVTRKQFEILKPVFKEENND